MRKLLIACCCVTLGIYLGLTLADAGPRIDALPMVNGVTYKSGDWNWSDAAKGGVKGSVTYAPRASRQPMVVYLVKVDDKNQPTTQGNFEAPSELSVRQMGAKFSPGFAVLQVGQAVKFKNDEEKEIAHNVYFLGAEDLDLGIFERGQNVTHKFTKSGSVSVHCSVHKRMDGKFFVAPTPGHALVAKAGKSFEIKGVPAGRYLLKTWQKQKRFKDITNQVVEIKKGETTNVAVAMKR
ncbi:MAG: cupredoxin domain-containing protein [Planctomycetota bacterium]|jgi:plastocyanin